MKKIKSTLIKSLQQLFFVAAGLVLQATLIITSAQVTGLNNWSIYLDAGHAQKENMGLYNYSEAEKVLRIAHSLKSMLETQTDIENVYMCRLTDADYISLEARVDQANALNPDFYYSIHSDAGAPETNSTLFLYGGWRKDGAIIEKTPNGGKLFGDILNADLPGVMRTTTRGNYADRTFYIASTPTDVNQFPYLYVNRVSTMASLLSEGGFHTNPVQQQRNMNAQWKELEALSAFRSILKFHDLACPVVGIATGIITDAESNLPANGVTVTIGDKTYVTDSYESLFNKYSTDPNQLRNGFYFINGLTPGDVLDVEFTSPNFLPLTQQLTIVSNPSLSTKDNLSLLDVKLTSTVPSVIVSVNPVGTLNNLRPGTLIEIKFSRKMNQASTEASISLSDPAKEFSFNWKDEFTLQIGTDNLDFVTDYTFTIDGSIAKNSLTDQFFDGDADGAEGGNYQFSIKTSSEDTTPPFVTAYDPSSSTPATNLKPIIRLVFSEALNASSISGEKFKLVAAGSSTPISTSWHHAVVNGKSVVHVFPLVNLNPSAPYSVVVESGIEDLYNNPTFEPWSFQFYIVEQKITASAFYDNFNTVNNWWLPNQSGSTVGIISTETTRALSNTYAVASANSTSSMSVTYSWDPAHSAPYIREYTSYKTAKFNIEDVLQMYVFGDGSNNEFRYVIRDGTGKYEASKWYKIDWIGWKLISWDLSNDPVYGWTNGDSKLDGSNFDMDGIHIRKASGGLLKGTLYFDDLHYVRRGETEYPTTLFESFETYSDFTTNLFPWRTEDSKNIITYGASGFDFPGMKDAFAFKVMNPALTTPSIETAQPAHDGNKYLFAMQSQSQNEDKWFISPQIKATDKTKLKFYAKSITDAWGLERFNVLVAEDAAKTWSFNPAGFQKISAGDYLEAPTEWTQYVYDLSSFDGKVIRFAIHDVSYDSYMLMLDKIEVVLESGTTNVKNLNSNHLNVYPNPTNGIVNIASESRIMAVEVYNIAGQKVASEVPATAPAQINLSVLPSGVYLLKVKTDTGLYQSKIKLKK
jgi:N-acetylmuramoyl-L-alanine amidase